jgi:hypothetical protein
LHIDLHLKKANAALLPLLNQLFSSFDKLYPFQTY